MAESVSDHVTPAGSKMPITELLDRWFAKLWTVTPRNDGAATAERLDRYVSRLFAKNGYRWEVSGWGMIDARKDQPFGELGLSAEEGCDLLMLGGFLRGAQFAAGHAAPLVGKFINGRIRECVAAAATERGLPPPWEAAGAPPALDVPATAGRVIPASADGLADTGRRIEVAGKRFAVLASGRRAKAKRAPKGGTP